MVINMESSFYSYKRFPWSYRLWMFADIALTFCDWKLWCVIKSVFGSSVVDDICCLREKEIKIFIHVSSVNMQIKFIFVGKNNINDKTFYFDFQALKNIAFWNSYHFKFSVWWIISVLKWNWKPKISQRVHNNLRETSSWWSWIFSFF